MNLENLKEECSAELETRKQPNKLDIHMDDLVKAFNIKEGTDKEKDKRALFTSELLKQSFSLSFGETDQEKLDHALVGISGVKPRDGVEAMLATQMLSIHDAAMRNLGRADHYLKSKDARVLEIGNKALNTANKLLRTFTMQMEALNRYRGKGQQKMIVEHVNVNAGGKAIIGNVEANEQLSARGGNKNNA